MSKTFIKEINGKICEATFSDQLLKKLGDRMNGWKPKPAGKPEEIKKEAPKTQAETPQKEAISLGEDASQDVFTPKEPQEPTELDQLKAKYKELYGEDPHGNWGVKKLTKVIADKELEIEEAGK